MRILLIAGPSSRPRSAVTSRRQRGATARWARRTSRRGWSCHVTERVCRMHRPMEGVRILEVAQFTFVPAAGAVLADWGADVIKIEHAERGDAQRGLVRLLGLDVASKGSSFFPIMEGPNRGKRSIGLALEKPGARAVLEKLVAWADVFVTNFL